MASAAQPVPDQDSVVRWFKDKSLLLAIKVTLLPDSQDWIVHVEPQIQRYNKGMPYLEPIEPGRADVPGWVTGKVDALAWDIHESLRGYAVRP